MLSQYGEEALNEIVAQLTTTEHYQKTMVIMAGYDREVRKMLEQNPGALGRFRQVWNFPDWAEDECTGFVLSALTKSNNNFDEASLRPIFNQVTVGNGWQQRHASRDDGDKCDGGDGGAGR